VAGRIPLLLALALAVFVGAACEPAATDPAGVDPAAAAPAPPDPALRSLGRFTVVCYALQGTTASGQPVSEEAIAVDPRVIPLGTRVHIENVGWRTALDTGGGIKGNKIDVWKPTVAACREFGRQNLEVVVAA
jgi:3D (Asp-Asp-Asp) domain-containing protein